MPKCNDCGNTETFLTSYRDVTVSKYDGGEEVDSWSVSYDRTDEKAQCGECGSANIEGEI